MKRSLLLVAAGLALTVLWGLTAVSFAQDKKAAAAGLEGTWQLVSRKMPDGSTVSPPMCQGLQTYTKTMRNFNVVWVDPSGKHFSYAVISNYKLTGTDYTETLLYSCMNDEIGVMKDKPAGAGPTYVMQSVSKTVPVTMDGAKIRFHLPFDPPEVVVDGNTLTATLEGGMVDTWQRLP